MTSPEANKETAKAFYDLAFNLCEPHEAVERFVGAEYRQHNPHVADGKEAFIEFCERRNRKRPDRRVEIKRAVAENDLVVLHCLHRWPGDEDYASMDIFRFDAQGRIVEHWDVVQPVPERSANENTMF